MATTTKPMTMSEHDRGPFVAPDEELAALKRAARALRAGKAGTPKLIATNGEEVALSPTLLRVLRRSVEVLADDRAVLLNSLGKQISPQEAATLLAVPVTYLVKLLDDGTLRFTLDGDFRRLSLAEVLAYRQELRARQHEALDELARLSQELGLYDLDYSTIKPKRLLEYEEEDRRAVSGDTQGTND